MNFSRIVVIGAATLVMCVTTVTVDAQPADVTRDPRPRPGADAKPNTNLPAVQPRPGHDAKPSDAAKNVRIPPRYTKPNEAARDPQRTTLMVQNILIPSNDPGKFNLRIDGVVKAFSVGNNGTTGAIDVTVGTHSVTEMAGISTTNLANYTTVIGGDCSPSGAVILAAGQNKTCTIRNTRKKAGPSLTEAPIKLDAVAVQVPPEVPHGSWTQGPGTYTFNICASGTSGALCNINGAPGQSITITMETWGAGGGGGGGEWTRTVSLGNKYGGSGAGGGGGGGYAKKTIAVVVPTSGALVVYYVKVGAAGASGQLSGLVSVINGGSGGLTEARLNNASGTLVLQASGGNGGITGNNHITGPVGGAGGNGLIGEPWAGAPGFIGGVANTCNGQAGGLGGAGAGPGRTGPGYINDGGNGGHGGYYKSIVNPTCLAHDLYWGKTPGDAGGNGKVHFVW